jgi:signal transduction histidine kinase
VERNARRLLRLVNSIMDFATAEAGASRMHAPGRIPFEPLSGRLTASYQPTHIGPYTLDLASSFRSAAEMAGLEFMVESTLPSNFVLWIDRDKYEKILYNLLSNVRPSSPAGSHSC